MSKWGFWGTVATIGAFMINPALGAAVAVSSVTGAAVFSDAEKTTSRRKVQSGCTDLTESGLRGEVEQLTDDIPEEKREQFLQAVEAKLKQEGRKLLGDKDGYVALARKDGKILAWISEDGEEGHTIEYQLP